MHKSTSAKKPSEIVEPSADAETPSTNNDIPAIALANFWLLEAGTAKKLGLRSAGSLSYQVLADHDWVFRSIVPTDSGPSCPAIPVHRAHPFRSIVPSLRA